MDVVPDGGRHSRHAGTHGGTIHLRKKTSKPWIRGQTPTHIAARPPKKHVNHAEAYAGDSVTESIIATIDQLRVRDASSCTTNGRAERASDTIDAPRSNIPRRRRLFR